MKKILVLLMVLTIVFPAVLAFCHCCPPASLELEAAISGPGMNCCDMVKTFFRECAPQVQKQFAVLAAFFIFFLMPVLLPLFRRVRAEHIPFETGPPLFLIQTPLFLSLKAIRI